MPYILALLFIFFLLLIVSKSSKIATFMITLMTLWFVTIDLDINDGVGKNEFYWDGYYTSLLAPINCFIRFTSAPTDREPILSNDLFSFHTEIESQWEKIAEEAKEALQYAMPSENFYAHVNPDNKGWLTVPLYWYEKNYVENIEKCPKTMELLKKDPKIKGAIFSILPGKHMIKPHIGPWKACMRYHLGLVVPHKKEDCFIELNGIKHSWEEGKGILFDDTFVHHVENNTDEMRIVLFLDVEKPLKYGFANKINSFLLNCGLPGYLSTKNGMNEQVVKVESPLAFTWLTNITNFLLDSSLASYFDSKVNQEEEIIEDYLQRESAIR